MNQTKASNNKETDRCLCFIRNHNRTQSVPWIIHRQHQTFHNACGKSTTDFIKQISSIASHYSSLTYSVHEMGYWIDKEIVHSSITFVQREGWGLDKINANIRMWCSWESTQKERHSWAAAGVVGILYGSIRGGKGFACTNSIVLKVNCCLEMMMISCC